MPVGAVHLFAERLAVLHCDLEQRREMSLNAYATINRAGYHIEDMAQRYIDLFRHVWQEVECGAFHRPSGKIILPSHLLREQWLSRLPVPVRAVCRYAKRAVRQLHNAMRRVYGSSADR